MRMIFNEMRERTSFKTRGKEKTSRSAGRRRWLKKIEKLKRTRKNSND